MGGWLGSETRRLSREIDSPTDGDSLSVVFVSPFQLLIPRVDPQRLRCQSPGAELLIRKSSHRKRRVRKTP